jgi:hypothetical protein
MDVYTEKTENFKKKNLLSEIKRCLHLTSKIFDIYNWPLPSGLVLLYSRIFKCCLCKQITDMVYCKFNPLYLGHWYSLMHYEKTTMGYGSVILMPFSSFGD